MKALLILIVTVGTSQANVDPLSTDLQVQQIEFSSIQACERAATRLTNAGRSTSDWAKTFAIEYPRDGLRRSQLFVAPPTVLAECVELQ